ncbi:MAG: hypothetical protein DME08_18535 [Candidatus Rokuibacteriota bacterium]|nr:MAG: hypothetical protein DME08_18535 [Candidatus Rokubacteria bacterium]
MGAGRLAGRVPGFARGRSTFAARSHARRGGRRGWRRGRGSLPGDGAVTSYAGLACQVGKPTAARAVAQALRWNPLPIVIPCHRVIGTSGALTGYAGDKLGLKQQLLSTEGVRTQKTTIPRNSMYVSFPGETFYCLPSCSWIPTSEHPHRLIFFGTRDRAEASGRTACGDCRPDLHPLTN